MALDVKQQAALALHRFGFGPRSGSIATIASDPRGALLAEIERPGAGRLTDPDLLTAGEAARATFDFRQERKAARLAQRAEKDAEKAAKAEKKPAENAEPKADMPPQKPRDVGPAIPQQIYLEEARARIDAALSAELGFAERLVWFWSNHFCISADKGASIRAQAGAYERETIRPFVLGRFEDMLLAVETHPAMLFYLDNARSFGPNSPAGQRQNKGLNENLAREILELHTLGVRSVYSQDDVTNFAKVITGWTIAPLRQNPEHGGEFVFNPRMHERGAQTVVGKSYADRGLEQGKAVLTDVARHPATAQHIASKLAWHFVDDDPPPSLVEKLKQRFLETNGDLKEVTKTLLLSPESWQEARTKVKRPGEWILGALRATGITPSDIQPVVQAQVLLGEPLWRPPAPKGFPDENAAWLDGVAQRLDIANQLARRVGGMIEPEAVVETALGPLASEQTRQAVARAESRPQALTLLLMAPEFQRR